MMNILRHWTEVAYANMCENSTLQSRYCIENSHKVLYLVVRGHIYNRSY